MAEQQLNAPACAEPGVPRSGVVHIRHRHTRRFVVVGNHLAQHENLSLTAIGLAVHIQSRPDGALVTIKALARRFREGEVAIARALRELEAAGYLLRTIERLPDGRRVTRTYAYDCPGHLRAATVPPAPKPPPPPARAPRPAAEPPPPATELQPTGGTAADPRATDVLATLRTRDERLLLSERDVHRLAPALTTWLQRGVQPDTALRTLAGDLPHGTIRHPAALLSHRLTHWLPPALPDEAHTPSATRPHPFQTCPACDRAFRAPHPGTCRDCSAEAVA